MFRRLIVLLAILVAGPAFAEGKRFTLTAAPAFGESGAAKFILPRFSLKTGVRIELVAEGGDATLAASDEGALVFQSVDGETVWRLAIEDGPAREHAERFREWLTSEVGLRAVEGYRPDGVQVFARLGDGLIVEEVAEEEGDAALGSELALRNCGRCHVIDKRNRFGGIGSTPSFGAMKNLPQWRDRFEAFWTLNPHPAFTQIEDMTEPFDPTRPPPIAPLELTLEEVEAIVAFVVSMPTKDLGGALVQQ